MRIYTNLKLLDKPNAKLVVIAAYKKRFGGGIMEAKAIIERLLADGGIEFDTSWDVYEDFIREHFSYDIEENIEEMYMPYTREPDAETQLALDWYETCTPEQRAHIDKLVWWFRPIAIG